jgi:hypothetical protein
VTEGDSQFNSTDASTGSE